MTPARRPSHPGKILVRELEARSLSLEQLSGETGIRLEQLFKIAEGQQSVDLDVAEAIALTFGTSPEFWLKLQENFDKWEGDRDSSAD